MFASHMLLVVASGPMGIGVNVLHANFFAASRQKVSSIKMRCGRFPQLFEFLASISPLRYTGVEQNNGNTTVNVHISLLT
jgi:hypothetical protein